MTAEGPLPAPLLAAALCGIVAALAALIAPRVSLSPGAASVFVFGGASLLAVLGAYVGTRARPSGRAAIAAVVVACAVLSIVGLARPSPRLGVPLVDAALVALAVAVGGSVGARIEHPGHLLPASIVAACADVLSVLSPSGPTHAILADERALALLAISFPIPGTPIAAPALGLGDVIFIALLLAAARAHGLSARRVAALSLLGLALAGGLSAAADAAVPALPAIVACVLLGLPAARRVRRRDRTVTWIAAGAALVLAGGAILRRPRSAPPPPEPEHDAGASASTQP